MNVIPQIAADLEEYPELRPLADMALRRVGELMSIHAIIELRRVHKHGVFDHPYTKDVITPIDLPTVPHTVRAGQHATGKALLDYLESIGISGLQLVVTQDDAKTMAALWSPSSGQRRKKPMKQEQPGDLDPKPAEDPKVPDPGQEKDPGQAPADTADNTKDNAEQQKEN